MTLTHVLPSNVLILSSYSFSLAIMIFHHPVQRIVSVLLRILQHSHRENLGRPEGGWW